MMTLQSSKTFHHIRSSEFPFHLEKELLLQCLGGSPISERQSDSWEWLETRLYGMRCLMFRDWRQMTAQSTDESSIACKHGTVWSLLFPWVLSSWLPSTARTCPHGNSRVVQTQSGTTLLTQMPCCVATTESVPR